VKLISARKIPQWSFVTQFFTGVLLKDRVAMAESGFSTKISVVRRAMLVGAGMLVAALLGAMVNSWLGNRALQRTVLEAAAAVPSTTSVECTPADLQQIERLRSVLAQLEQHRRAGVPLSLRWGMYSGKSLYPEARKLYFSRFHALLLAVTQERLVKELSVLPGTPDPAHDYASTYAALKAYLIITEHHDKSERGFLSPVLYTRWLADRRLDETTSQLAQRQFDFYAETLPAGNPFFFVADENVVTKGRAYLRGFGDEERLYQAAIGQAAQINPLNFNRLYAGSDRIVISRTVIPGAFTKAGYAVVQSRFNHLKDDLGKEEWVLGAQSSSGSIADLETHLRQRYGAEFASRWRALLSEASVSAYANYSDAANKLELLTTPSYPLLALFALVSDNTDVEASEIASMFQPVRAVVAPNSPNPVQPANQNYLKVLGDLQSAMKQASLAPPNDPAATAQVLSAVSNAYGGPREIAQRFDTGKAAGIELIALSLLNQPIRLAENVAKTGPAGALNGAGQAFCSQFAPLARKFPFNSAATEEASLEELDSIFAPSQGKALFDFYSGVLQKYIVKQGSQYVAPSSDTLRIAPEFLRWFNSMAGFADALYPGGSPQPRLGLSLTQSAKNRFSDLSITVDGEKLSGGSRQFTWPGKKPGITISERGDPLISFEGPWALFRFASEANWEAAAGAAELQFRLQTNGRQQKFADGTDKIVYYELRMSNPTVLQRPHLAAMRNCVSRVASVR
jgi:type VI secretion system protein ImpL